MISIGTKTNITNGVNLIMIKHNIKIKAAEMTESDSVEEMYLN